MGYNIFIEIALFLVIFSCVKSQKLNLTYHKSKVYPFKTRTWTDLLDVIAECPNEGVMKNFILKKNSNSFWYEFYCYSAVQELPDYGEPIIKQVYATSTVDSESFYITTNLKGINEFTLQCALDYGLNKFGIYQKSNKLDRYTYCHGLKASFTSTLKYATSAKTCSYSTFDALFDVVVGSQEIENDVDIGYPLRGFKYVVDTSRNYYYPTVYYVFSYSKLRNMKIVKDDYKRRFEELRKNNNQAN